MHRSNADMQQALSAHTVTPPPPNGIPPIIQGVVGDTSALAMDQSVRLLMEERNKSDREKMAMQKTINELRSSVATGPTQDTSNNSNRNRERGHNKERIKRQDSKGHTWFQIAHYCSKHGYNSSHSNEACEFKQAQDGRGTWIAGASAADNKGGSNKNADKCLQWFNPRTRQTTPTLP